MTVVQRTTGGRIAGFPAGLVIYWTWNNLLSIGQQWLMMRRTRLEKPGLART